MSNVINKLNHLLADSQVIYTKLHNFHWHVKGPNFYQIHLKTEELYTHFGTLYDDLAERIIQLGGSPYVTLKQIMENTRIKEVEKTTFTASELFGSIKEDFEFLHKEFGELSKLVEGDQATTGLVDTQIAFLEKEIWMLNSSIA